MTARCGGDPSEARPGVAGVQILGAGALALLLERRGYGWLSSAASFIAPFTFDLQTFCATDPVAVSDLTAADLAALANPYNPFAYFAAVQKMRDLIGNLLWPVFCQCSFSADTGTFPTQDPVTPIPDFGQGTRGGGSPQACWHGELTNNVGVPTPASTWHLANIIIPQYRGASLAIDDPRQFVRIPASSGTLSLSVVKRTDLGGGDTLLGLRTYREDFSDPISHLFGMQADNILGITTYSIPSDHVWLSFFQDVIDASETAFDVYDYAIDLDCGNPPGGTSVNCCPTDANVLGLLTRIDATVQLIQRQAVPFAYVDGSVHSGLSGDGHIDVQGLLGARVLITTLPQNVGIEDGDPLTYWHAGWITWGNADGSTHREFISASPMVSLPALAGQFTRLGYTLAPDVVISITELEREP